jgi:hypothetical protein
LRADLRGGRARERDEVADEAVENADDDEEDEEEDARMAGGVIEVALRLELKKN